MALYTSSYTGLQIDQAIKNPDNKIINGAFQVNQRAVTSTVTLAAGIYGHDMWKAGTGGCTYTFAASGGVTTLTISAGSLQQVVEGVNLETATYCLSWTGTAQGKIGAGSYGASGVTGAVTGGTNLTIEFGTGTLAKVKLEQGAVATPFRMPGYGEQFAMCRRFFKKVQYCSGIVKSDGAGAYIFIPFGNPMRAAAASITYDTLTDLLAVPGVATLTPTAYVSADSGIYGVMPYFTGSFAGYVDKAVVLYGPLYISAEL
jgi:hypothetical protein